jgi:midasin
VQGGADSNDNNEQASAQQEKGEESKADVPEQGQGTDNSESAEQEQKAGSAAQKDQDPAQQKNPEEEEKTEKQSEFQKVGDILEKWHKQRREILQANEEKDDKPAVDDMVCSSKYEGSGPLLTGV